MSRIFKKILITGISGSGGSYLAEHILKKKKKLKIYGFYRTKKNLQNLDNVFLKKIITHQIDMNDYSKGLYHMNLISNDKIVNRTLIVE